MSPAAPRRRSVPAGLLGMLALVAAVEAAVFRGDDLDDDKAASWSAAGSAAAGPASRADVLLLGDSTVKFGLLPRILDDESARPRSSYNLAVFDGPPAVGEVLLRRAFEAGARPSTVVVGVMPHQLALEPTDPRHRRAWSELLSVPEAIRLAVDLGEPALPAPAVLGRLLPSVRCRDAARANLIAALGGDSRSARNVVRLYRRNWRANLGAHVLATRSGPGVVDLRNGELFPPSWTAEPGSIAALRRLIRLAGSRGAAVFLLVPPLHPEALARHRESGLAPRFDGALDRLAEEFLGLVVLDGRPLGIPADRFADAVHLDRLGASALSASVAKALTRALSSDRWVVLESSPLADLRRLAGLVEDIDATKSALLDDRARRR